MPPGETLESLLNGSIFQFMAIFCRVGSAVMLLPGLGEAYVPQRVRLVFALMFSLALMPMLADKVPVLPADLDRFVMVLATEIGIGLFFGTVVRCTMIALEIAGTVISFQIGLATASIFNPLLSDQGSVTSVLITITGLVLMFQTDLHHLMLRALIDSYTLFSPGNLPPIGDFTEVVSRTVTRSFAIGMQLSAPFLVILTLMYVALGLMSRLMPQLQIFFVALPLQIGLGFLILLLTFSTLMLWFLENFGDVLRMFVGST